MRTLIIIPSRRIVRDFVIERDLASFRVTEGSLSMAGFERQFREHADAAKRHGGAHRLPVAANAAISRLIVVAYRLMRVARRITTA